MSRPDEGRAGSERRFLWPSLAAPGVVWLVLLFLVPLYAVLAVAMGTPDPIFGGALPAWNPLAWDPAEFKAVFGEIFTGQLGIVFLRTIVYVAVATLLSLLIGYPVAYYLARHAGRYRVLLLLLIIAPFWINYLMRMLAWVNLLSTDGYVNQVLMFVGILDEPQGVAGRQALDGYPRPRLRLRAVPDTAALRRAGPHRPARDRSRARPRGRPRPGFLARDAAALEAGDSGRVRYRDAAHVRRLLHRRRSSRGPPRRTWSASL